MDHILDFINKRRTDSQWSNPTCCLSCIVNTIPADALATYGARYWPNTPQYSDASIRNVYYRSSATNIHFIASWRRHQMETFSAFLSLCEGNSPVTSEIPSQRSVTRSFDVFFDLCLNKRLRNRSRRWWFETPSRPLWRHCNGVRSISTKQDVSFGSLHSASFWRIANICIRAHSPLLMYRRLLNIPRMLCIWYSKYIPHGQYSTIPKNGGCTWSAHFYVRCRSN